MDLQIGSKLSAALASASDAAKAKAASAMKAAQEMAAKGAAAVGKGVTAVLENDLASAVAIKGIEMIPGVGTAAGLLAKGVKAGYDYALKGEKDYKSADAYLDGRLKDSALVHCGGNVKKEKARRRRERETMIASGKASPDPKKRAAAERLERDMVAVERARLSKHVYDANDPEKIDTSKVPPHPPPPPTGFLAPSEDELLKLGLTPDELAPQGSSFRAQVYMVDPDVGPIPPEYVVAYRGTVTKEDWTQANIPQGVGRETDSYTRAMAIARTMAEPPAKAVEFTGHSLGGGLASAAAVVTGFRASTQNSAGLHENTTKREGTVLDREKAKAHVNAYRIDGAEKTEILSSINKLPVVPDAVGEPRQLEPPKAGVSRLGLHSIDAVIDSIEDQKTADQQTLRPR